MVSFGGAKALAGQAARILSIALKSSTSVLRAELLAAGVLDLAVASTAGCFSALRLVGAVGAVGAAGALVSCIGGTSPAALGDSAVTGRDVEIAGLDAAPLVA